MPTTFAVERFEHVTATAETALLRVSGRWHADQRERLSPPMLVVDDGSRTHRLAALPGPEDAAPLAGPDGPGWRAAFSAPLALVEGANAAFARAAGGGAVVALPRPVAARRERRPAVESPPPPPAAAIDEAALAASRAEAERRARERREAMRALEALLEDERHARIEADRRAAHEAAVRERLEAESARHGGRLAALETELAVAQDARLDAERVSVERADELADARRQLHEQLTELDSLRAALADAGRAGDELAGELTQRLSTEVAAREQAQDEATTLRAQLAETQHECDALEAQL